MPDRVVNTTFQAQIQIGGPPNVTTLGFPVTQKNISVCNGTPSNPVTDGNYTNSSVYYELQSASAPQVQYSDWGNAWKEQCLRIETRALPGNDTEINGISVKTSSTANVGPHNTGVI